MRKVKTFYEILAWTAFVVISILIAKNIFFNIPKVMKIQDCFAVCTGYAIIMLLTVGTIERSRHIKLQSFDSFGGLKSMIVIGLFIGFILGYTATRISFHTDLGEIGDRFKFHSTMIISLFITFYVGWHFEFNKEIIDDIKSCRENKNHKMVGRLKLATKRKR